jgi:hypothetical protein
MLIAKKVSARREKRTRGAPQQLIERVDGLANHHGAGIRQTGAEKTQELFHVPYPLVIKLV